jgi:hypothetical protein
MQIWNWIPFLQKYANLELPHPLLTTNGTNEHK